VTPQARRITGQVVVLLVLAAVLWASWWLMVTGAQQAGP
jgi:hypothetical protein